MERPHHLRKMFIPLENNPAVFNPLARHLGLAEPLTFYDVLSLTEATLLADIPRPVRALLVVMPPTAAFLAQRTAEEAARCGPAYGVTAPAAEPVFWMPQTIRNACGLMGLIHCVGNLDASAGADVEGAAATGEHATTCATAFFPPESIFGRFFEASRPLPPAERAELLYQSQEFEDAHAAAGVRGDTVAPTELEDDVWGHFIAFVRGKDGHLYELEGSRKGPVDRGLLDPSDGGDLLAEQALELGVGKLLRTEQDAGGSSDNLQLSCVALA